MYVTVQNFVTIGQTVAEIGLWRFFHIFQNDNRPPPRICFEHIWTTLYHCTKFRQNRCSSFDNMQALIFNEFGLKMPTHVPKWRFWGNYAP